MAEVGQLVAGRYRLVRPLGAGGMSQVWLAIDRAGRHVAVKRCVPPPGLTAGEQDLIRRWTIRDARAFARVDHPHVIRTLGVVPEGDQPWIVMEYVPSRSLMHVVDESGPLSPARAAGIGLAVLDGLRAVVRAGLLHLDVKPSNVLIADDGRVVLSDFGPVVTESGIAALAAAGIVLGSPNYLAPERLLDGASTARADLWSLGATLYYAVEGRPPFQRATTGEILRALGDSPPDRTELAGPLAGVLNGLLRRDPAARLTAAEVEKRLRALAAARPVRLEPPPVRRRTTLPRRAAAAVTAVAVALVLATAAGGSRGDTRPSGSAPAPAALSRTAIPSPAPFVLPGGYWWWTGPSGFRVVLAGFDRPPGV